MRPPSRFDSQRERIVILRRDRHRERRGRTATILATAAITVGLVLAGGALVALRQDRSTPTAFGSLTWEPTDPGLAVNTSALAAPTSHPVPGVPVRISPAVADTSTMTRPVALRVPALGVSAPVERVVTRGGVLGVPDDISHVGWWTGSAVPGSPAGATVIDGHVDSAADGEGALFHVTDLRAGQAITLTTTSGRDVTYQVYARRIYSKTHALPTTLFDTAGPPRLVLITCGGPFDAARHSYQDNIAVFARPVT